jgi:hypothetical protein
MVQRSMDRLVPEHKASADSFRTLAQATFPGIVDSGPAHGAV